MAWFAWWTSRSADTDNPDTPELGPQDYSQSPAEVLELLRQTLNTLPRWQVESFDPTALTLHATQRSALFRWLDDVRVRLEAHAGGTRLHARAERRASRHDWGQNRRNLLQLFAALRKRLNGRRA
jgi:uncharacterized protein (DUF1499 family)